MFYLLRFVASYRHYVFFYTYTILYIIPLKLLLINGFGDKCCWRQPFSPTLKRCLGCLSLGEKQWSQYFPSLSSPQELGIYRHTPPSLCTPWHPSHGLLCHSLTLAPSTGLNTWQAALGSRTTLIPTPFTHINGVFPIVHDIQWYLCLSCTWRLGAHEPEGWRRQPQTQVARTPHKPALPNTQPRVMPATPSSNPSNCHIKPRVQWKKTHTV